MGMAIVRLPALKHVREGQDAWLGILIGTAAGTLLLWGILRLVTLKPGRDLLDLSTDALGPLLGRAVAVCYVLYFTWDALLSLRLYSGLLIAQPLPETPAEAFIFLVAGAAAYAATKGPEVLGRLGELLAPLILAGVLLVLLLGINQMDPLNLRPFLGSGLSPVLRASTFPAFVFSETLVCTLFLPHMAASRKAIRAALAGGVLGGVVSALAAAALVMFYGSKLSIRLAFPLYDLARTVSIGEFFERLDPLFIIIWTAATFLKVAILLWGVAHCAAKLLRLKRAAALILPLALLFSFSAMRAYATQAEITTLASIQIYPLFTFPSLIVFPLILALGSAFRRGKSV